MKIEFEHAVLKDENIEKYREIELSIRPMTPGARAQTTIETEEIVEELQKFLTNFICRDGVVVGLISCRRSEPNGLYLNELAIMPRYQGMHIGRLAMKLLMRPMLPSLDHAWLVTHPRNSRALRLYLGLGFEIREWRDDYFGDGEPRLILDLKDRDRMYM